MTKPNSILLLGSRLLLLAVCFACLPASHAGAQSRTPSQNSAIRLTVQPTAVAVGDTVTFAVGSNAAGTTVFEYVFGDGSAQRTTSRRLTYVYAEPGTYRASARIFTTDDVTVSSAVVPVTVSPRPIISRTPTVTTPPVLSRAPIVTRPDVQPSVRLQADRFQITVGESVHFTAHTGVRAAAASVGAYAFTFGDGTSEQSRLPEIDHVYSRPGTYDASVQLVGAQGAVAQSPTVRIQVIPRSPPRITLSADRSRITAGEGVQFRATVTDGPPEVGYTFIFGDGAGERSPRPEIRHIYAGPGTYDASVQLFGQQGVLARSPAVRIVVDPAPRPRIALSGAPSVVGVGETVAFTIRTEDVSGPAVYEIAFGDGTQQRLQSQNVSHVYREPGTYRVTAGIVGEDGFVAESNAVTITVRPERPVVLQLAAEPRRITEGQSVRFRASMDRQVAAGGYSFSFGDGAVERTPVPAISHVYPRSGRYTASVQLVGNEGVIAQSAAVPIVVEPAAPLSISLRVDRASPEVGDRVRFTATLSADRPPEAAYIFSFGDGRERLSTIEQTEYAYAEPGAYRATVRLDAGGETLTASAPVEIVVPTPPIDPGGGPDPLEPDTSSGTTPPVTDGSESGDTTNTDPDSFDEPRFPTVSIHAEPGTLSRGRPVILSAIVEPDTLDLEFRFRYGDGSMTDWMSVREAQYAYAQTGSYAASVEARYAQTQEILASTATVLVNVVSPRIPLWIYLIGVVLAALVVGFVLTRHRMKDGSTPRDEPERPLVEAALTVAAHADAGWAEIHTPARIEWEVRIRPVPDDGTHHMSSSGDLILSERRSDGSET